MIKKRKHEKEKSIDLLSLLDNDIDIEEEYLYFFSIIINDYINYPNIIHNYNVKKIIKFIINFYCPNKFVMKYNYKNNCLNLKNEKILKIFGKKFVENNKNNCFLFINEKILGLVEYIDINSIYEDNNFYDSENIIITLYEKENEKINDISYMFYEVTSLLSLSDNSTFDTININNMRYTFYGCKSLEYLNCIILLMLLI